jgi:hypothetical protein
MSTPSIEGINMPSQPLVINTGLTINEAVNLAAIIDGCKRNAKATWEDRGQRFHTGLAHGTLRAICDEHGNRYPADEDVRAAHVWITTASGFEWFPTLQTILNQYEQGLFALDFS